jgi:hypothetical protein
VVQIEGDPGMVVVRLVKFSERYETIAQATFTPAAAPYTPIAATVAAFIG